MGGTGGGPDGGGPGTASLTVSPETQRVTAGSGGITLHATLVGDTGPISWALSGPGTLGAASGVETTYTPPASVDAETVATVTASAGAGLSAAVQITIVPAAEMDVSGRVVGPTGVGLSGLSVGIGTKTALTGSDGRFSISGVVPPYDVNVVLSDGRIRAGRYEGLTRSDPTLPFLWLFTTGEPNTATIAGTVSGGQPVGIAGEFTAAFFTTTDVRFDLSTIGITARNNPFTLPISWFGQESITGTLHVLQFQAPQTGVPPTAFTGYGTHAGVAVSRDGAVEGADVVLSAPGTASIGGTALPPDGYTVDTKFLNLEVAALTSVPLGHVEGADTGFTFTVPEGIPATAAVTVSAVRTGVGTTSRRVSGIAPRTTGVSVALPAPALPIAPADGAHGPTGDTLFTWTPLEHAVHLVVIDSGDAVPSLFVVTGGTSTRVPLLSSGTTYQWYVGSFGPFDGLDAFTAGANLFPALGDSFQTVSAIRTFVAE
jgi:hypothetical protein